MMTLIKLVLIGALLFIGYLFLEPQIVEWEILEKAGLAPEKAPEPELAPPVFNADRHIVCPACRGEGRLTYKDRRAQNHVYPCRVCGSTGFRRLTLHGETWRLCPDCQGMGRYAVKEKRRDSADGNITAAHRCRRCAASGQIQVPRGVP